MTKTNTEKRSQTLKNVRFSFRPNTVTLVVVVNGYLRRVTVSSQLMRCILRRGALIYMHQPVIQSIRPSTQIHPPPCPRSPPYSFPISPFSFMSHSGVAGNASFGSGSAHLTVTFEICFFLIWPY